MGDVAKATVRVLQTVKKLNKKLLFIHISDVCVCVFVFVYVREREKKKRRMNCGAFLKSLHWLTNHNQSKLGKAPR